ncbi:hypothetical protein F5Y16DRAFT_422960 [Xylariaceae sp. FL0255]|nr:hypothetical protein F5Y16DRAFT_422960 [Xylariaceae sp. FL0255]
MAYPYQLQIPPLQIGQSAFVFANAGQQGAQQGVQNGGQQQQQQQPGAVGCRHEALRALRAPNNGLPLHSYFPAELFQELWHAERAAESREREIAIGAALFPPPGEFPEPDNGPGAPGPARGLHLAPGPPPAGIPQADNEPAPAGPPNLGQGNGRVPAAEENGPQGNEQPGNERQGNGQQANGQRPAVPNPQNGQQANRDAARQQQRRVQFALDRLRVGQFDLCHRLVVTGPVPGGTVNPAPGDDVQIIGSYTSAHEANENLLREVRERYGGIAHRNTYPYQYGQNRINLEWIRRYDTGVAPGLQYPNHWQIGDNGCLRIRVVDNNFQYTVTGELYIVH